MSTQKGKVIDLRSALELLKSVPDQLIETNEFVEIRMQSYLESIVILVQVER